VRATAVTVAVVFVALCATFTVLAGGKSGKPRPRLQAAVARTEQVGSERYGIHVRLTRDGAPLSLHIHGQASRHTVSVNMHTGTVHLADGTSIPGRRGAALLDGQFLYELAPGGAAAYGPVHWLRLSVPSPSSSSDLRTVHALTPAPMLRVLESASARRSGPGTFRGTLAYDDPVVRNGLSSLTGGIQFRRLRFTVTVGSDGLVHRIVVIGRTADGRTALSLRAQLYAFGRGVHVTPPAPGTFLDRNLDRLKI